MKRELLRLHALAREIQHEARMLSAVDKRLRIELEDVAQRAQSLQSALFVLWHHARDSNNQLGER